MNDKAILLEDEVLIIEESGEMPEVAMHGSIYYLCEDPEGPGLRLDHDDHLALKKAVISRYQTIILRDLTPENRKKSLYRGMERSEINWQRLKLFAVSENLDIEVVRQKVSAAICVFLEEEKRSVHEEGEISCINCSSRTVKSFLRELGLDPDELCSGWEDLCPDE